LVVYIDSHEPKNMKIELNKNGISSEIHSMDVGDYRFGEYTVERKTVKDFLNSIYSRRIYDQLYNLQQAEKPVLIIVGEIPPKEKWVYMGKRRVPIQLTYEEQVKRYDTIRANKILAYTSFNVQVFHALDEDDFIEHIVQLYSKSTKKGESLRPLKKKSKSIKNVKIDILGSIPCVGSKLATEVAKSYPIRRVFNMTIEELCDIPGIGNKTAKSIEECVTK